MQDDPQSAPKKGSLAERLVGRMNSQGMQTTPHHDALAAGKTPDSRPKVPEADAGSDAASSRTPDAPAISAPHNSPDIQINLQRLQKAGFITPSVDRNATTEEFRVIKRQLLKTVFTEGRQKRSYNSNVLMVTSSVPNEGKTFISLNLAMSFTLERDLHVLLVDADSHRHGLTNLLCNEQERIGLVDLLVDPTLQLGDVILRTNVPNLSYIPGGRSHPHGAELMASKEMTAMMKELALRYPDRLIIIDTPPLLASTEGIIMSSHVGHAIVVVEKYQTSKRSLHHTLELLEGCQEVSCVLNRDTVEQGFSRYTHGY